MADKLQDLKATYKRQELLLPDLERHVVRQDALPTDRRTDAMHPSAMAKSRWCPRHDYFQISGETPDYPEEPNGFRRVNQFDYGHHIHHKYQRWLGEMGILWGLWECRNCKHRWTATSPTWCPQCDAEGRWRYLEVPLDWPEQRITGHADGVVFLDTEAAPEGEYEALMIEIKSIGIQSLRFEAYPLFEQYQQEQMTPEEAWFLIKRPFASHIRQGSMYLHLGKLIYPKLELDRIIFIYEWKATQEVKEFVISYNPERIEGILDGVDAVNAALDYDEAPDRPAWAAIDDKGCRSCEYRSTCWGPPGTPSQATVPLRIRRAPAAHRRAIRF